MSERPTYAPTELEAGIVHNRARWIGRAISALTALVMVADGVISLLWPKLITSAMAGDGWPPETVLPIAVGALASGLIYAFPRTAFIGAILITRFVGGALAVHFRVTMALIWPEIVNILIAVAAWTGLCLREPRLQIVIFFNRR